MDETNKYSIALLVCVVGAFLFGFMICQEIADDHNEERQILKNAYFQHGYIDALTDKPIKYHYSENPEWQTKEYQSGYFEGILYRNSEYGNMEEKQNITIMVEYTDGLPDKPFGEE